MGFALNHLRFLHYLDEVARVGSIRQAAERLHVAPSAVNRRIQDLEEELGTPIFERLPRGMRLTAAGELFVGYIRTREADLAQVRSKIEDLQGLRRGTVKVVVSQAVASVFLPKHIAHFRTLHPMVEFQVQVGGHRQALNALRTFETELALVFNLAPENDIQILSELEQPLCVMMHKDHPLTAKPGKIRLRDCAEYPLVLPSDEMAGRQLLNDYLVRRSLKLRPAIESNSFDFIRGYLYYEQALSFQVAIGVMTDGGQLLSRDIDDSGFPKGKLVLAGLRGRQLPVIVYAFAEYISQVFAGSDWR